MSVATVGLFAVAFAAVVTWSPLARGLVRESVVRPNEPCTFTPTSDGKFEVHRKVMPEDLPPGDQPAAPEQEVIGSSSHFKYVLGATVILTLLALVAFVALVFAPGDRAASAGSTCEKAFIFGFSALIGLIGGKAIK